MKYFTIAELTRSTIATVHNINNTPSPQVVARLTTLIEQVLDPLREAWGAPLRVNSGYRCKQLNHIVGGMPGSQHLRGEAVDVTTGSVAGNARLYRLIKKLDLPVDQVINEHDFGWIHVSCGPRHRKQFFAVRS